MLVKLDDGLTIIEKMLEYDSVICIGKVACIVLGFESPVRAVLAFDAFRTTKVVFIMLLFISGNPEGMLLSSKI